MTQTMSNDLVELVADDLGRQVRIVTAEEENSFSFYDDPKAVSYTHLDVYKRQLDWCACGRLFLGLSLKDLPWTCHSVRCARSNSFACCRPAKLLNITDAARRAPSGPGA